jgi:hypothetical protein
MLSGSGGAQKKKKKKKDLENFLDFAIFSTFFIFYQSLGAPGGQGTLTSPNSVFYSHI